MLRTLFGDLAPRLMPGTPRPAPDPAGAADPQPPGTDAVALDARTSHRVDQGVDVVVDSSAAAAMRAHFAATRSDLDQAGAMITLLDPARLWAGPVIAALSEAAGRPVERLNLRERGTLRTLAVIERTTVPRLNAAPLKVYHADIRATGLEQEEIANALAEGSHLTAVIMGALQPHVVVGLLRSVVAATRQPEWRCPWLVFVVPPGAPALRQRILEQDWPAHVRVAALCEPLASASSVWNTVLTAWEAACATATPASAHADGAGADDAAEPAASAAAPSLESVQRALAVLARTDGLLGCGFVNLGCGDLLALQTPHTTQAALARAAAALCAARQVHLGISGTDGAPADEILVTTGAQQCLLRASPVTGSMGFVALLDRSKANLALLRFRLVEAERYLA